MTVSMSMSIGDSITATRMGAVFSYKKVLVKWLWEETRVPKVVSSNLVTVYWMDIFTFICCKNCSVCLKRLK